MRLQELDEEGGGVGLTVKGVNTTADVGVDTLDKQTKKYGFKTIKQGRPPKLRSNGKLKEAQTIDQEFNNDIVVGFAEDILKYCKPFFKYTQTNLLSGKWYYGDLLYHGRRNYSGGKKIELMPIKKRKQTKGGDRIQTRIFHKMMRDDGFTATRGNSIFTSRNPDDIGKFGIPYVAIPKGNYSLTWMDKQLVDRVGNDIGGATWYYWLVDFINSSKNTGYDLDVTKNTNIRLAAEYFWEINSNGFHHGTDIHEATKTSGEIMLYAKNVYLIERTYFDNEFKFVLQILANR